MLCLGVRQLPQSASNLEIPYTCAKLIYIYIKNSSALNKILEPFEDEFADLNSSDIALFISVCGLLEVR